MHVDKIPLPPAEDKRRKLTPEQRADILASVDSARSAAKRHGVSRRLVQFIRHPDKVMKNLEARDKRGGRSYDRKAHAERVRDLRRRKRALLPRPAEIEDYS